MAEFSHFRSDVITDDQFSINGRLAMGRTKPVVLSTITFDRQGDAKSFFGKMLQSYKPRDRVSPSDKIHLRDLLDRHPDAVMKIGVGIDWFEVQEAD